MPIQNPRTVDDILISIDDTYQDVDPALDSRKGPVAVMDYAYATELARTENTADYLRTVYQLGNPESLEDEDIVQLGLNYGKDPNIGRPARVTLTLGRLSPPPEGEIASAEAGIQVGTSDGRFVFVSLNLAEMNGDFPDTYFNSQTGLYEVNVEAEAVSVGIDYNLPPGTINRFVTPVDDFDEVTNAAYAIGGTDPIDKLQFRDVIWSSLQGIGSESAGNIGNLIEDLDPTGVDDFSIVPSTDYINFARLKVMEGRVGYDVYIITDTLTEETQSGFSQGGETFLSIEKRPIASVRFVLVNGVEVPYSVEIDTDPAVARSPLANDGISFTTPLQPAQPYQIIYSYYQTVYDANAALQDRTRLFGTDVLTRMASMVQIVVVASLKTSSGESREDVIENIVAFTNGYLRNPDFPSSQRAKFYELLSPLDYQNAVEQNVDGVVDFRLERFARQDRAYMDVEDITFNGLTEYPILSPEFTIR